MRAVGLLLAYALQHRMLLLHAFECSIIFRRAALEIRRKSFEFAGRASVFFANCQMVMADFPIFVSFSEREKPNDQSSFRENYRNVCANARRRSAKSPINSERWFRPSRTYAQHFVHSQSRMFRADGVPISRGGVDCMTSDLCMYTK